MSLTLCYGFLILAVLALVLGRARAAVSLILIAAGLFYLLGTNPLISALLNQLQPYRQLLQPTWRTKNVIVVLGAGTVRSSLQPEVISIPTWANARLTETARLYHSCRKSATSCTVLATGGDPAKHGISEAQVIANELKALGVNEADIVREEKSRNTFQNAKFSAPLLQEGHYDRVFLVTSGFHILRAQMLFTFFGVDTIPSPADRLEAIRAYLPVSFNYVFVDLTLHEFMGILQFHTYNLMGWN